jgi:hypothetical protein
VADDRQRQQHVVEHVAIEQQLAILKDQPELAAQVGNGVPAQRSEILTVDHDAARGRALDGRQQFEQRRFAGAGVAGEKNHLAGGDFEAHIP